MDTASLEQARAHAACLSSHAFAVRRRRRSLALDQPLARLGAVLSAEERVDRHRSVGKLAPRRSFFRGEKMARAAVPA
jgi:hypothetical protein